MMVLLSGLKKEMEDEVAERECLVMGGSKWKTEQPRG